KLLFSQDYKWRLLRATGSKTPDSPLRISYWSTTPSRLGPSAVKYMAAPDLAETPPTPAIDSPDRLRLAMAAHLATGAALFDLSVQARGDPIAMPVEDPTVPWDASWQKVAMIPASRPSRSTRPSSRRPARICPSRPGTRCPSIGRWGESTVRERRSTARSRSRGTSSTESLAANPSIDRSYGGGQNRGLREPAEAYSP